MSYANDRVTNALRRFHDVAYNTTIDVYEPSVSYAQGEGWTVTYPSSADASYEARVDSPSSIPEKGRSGTTAELDAIVRVSDDTNQQWTGWGEEETAPAQLVDTADGTRYEVQDVVDQHDGLTKLEVVEA